MIRFVRLWLTRLLVFGLLIGLTHFTIFIFFPYIDRQMPWVIAILLTYCFVAYIGIPSIIRIFRIFDKPNHIPLVSTTGDGWPSDPVNIAVFAASERDFIWAMNKAGWRLSDEGTIKNLLHEGWVILVNQPYAKAPLSNLYLFGRKQDLSFQIPVGNSPRNRHHVRFWRVTHESLLDLHDEHEHQNFWRKLFKKIWNPTQHLWVGAAILDSGPVAICWRNGQITHLVDPNADLERDFIIESLKKAHVLEDLEEIKAGSPYRGRGQILGMTIISDGFVKVCDIKPQVVPPSKRAVQESLPLKRRQLKKIKS